MQKGLKLALSDSEFQANLGNSVRLSQTNTYYLQYVFSRTVTLHYTPTAHQGLPHVPLDPHCSNKAVL